MIRSSEVAVAIMRVFLGITFIIHGAVKFSDGIEYTVGFFEMLGLPGFAAYAVAIFEIVGGIALVLGLGTRIVSLLFVILLAVATLTAKLSVGFLGNGQMAGYELDLALIVIAILLVTVKNPFFALDRVLFRSEKA